MRANRRTTQIRGGVRVWAWARNGAWASARNGACCAALLCFAADARATPLAQPQDVPLPVPGRLPGEGAVKADSTGPLLASDGQPASPGRVPSDASDLGRERFEVLRASLAGAEPMLGFELPFQFVQRSSAGTSDGHIRLRYLDEGPGLVDGAILDREGRVKQSHMRAMTDSGRASYWGRLKDGTVQPLKGRDFRTSREDLDGWASMAHDLLLLTQPDRLRLLRLGTREVKLAGTGSIAGRALQLTGEDGETDTLLLPRVDTTVALTGVRSGPLAERAAQLHWIEVVTPDIRLWQERAGEAQPRRLLLGLDPKSGVPEIAVLAPTLTGTLNMPGLVLIHLADWRAYGGARRLPRGVRMFERRLAEGAEREHANASFRTRSALDLVLLEDGRLGAAGMTAESFRPR